MCRNAPSCTCVTYAYKGQGKGPGGSYVVVGAPPPPRVRTASPKAATTTPPTFQEHRAEGPMPCRSGDRREMRPPPTGRSTTPDLPPPLTAMTLLASTSTPLVG